MTTHHIQTTQPQQRSYNTQLFSVCQMESEVSLCNRTTHHCQTSQPQQRSYNEQPLSLRQALSQPQAPTGICTSETWAWVKVDRLRRSASNTQTFVTPGVSTQKTFGERSFHYTVPCVWDALPQTFHHSDSSSSFKATLKTHLFNDYF